MAQARRFKPPKGSASLEISPALIPPTPIQAPQRRAGDPASYRRLPPQRSVARGEATPRSFYSAPVQCSPYNAYK